MITIKNLSKEFKQYNARSLSLKSLAINWKLHKEILAKRNKETFCAINNLSVTIEKSEIFCITGSNGSGKSTLAKLIAGTIPATSGTIRTEGKIIPFLELGVAFNSELPAIDNLYLNGALLGLRLSFLKRNKEKIFDFAEINDFINTPLKYFSSGMLLRLAFSIAMHAEGDIYIFDEILAVGDSNFQKKCFKCFDDLIKKKKTIIVITHDINFIKQHATKTLILSPPKHIVISDASLLNAANDLNDLISHCN